MKVKLLSVVIVVVSVLIAGTAIILAQEAETTPTPAPSAETDKPGAETTPTPTPSAETGKQEVKKIDINSATLKELETLPGIGTKIAQAIIRRRPYEKIEDIMKVQKIGEKRFAKIKDLIEVKPIKKTEEQQTEGTPTPTETPQQEATPTAEATPTPEK
jgi:competence ComEA-like helix-hairpin-helix protein